MRRLCCPRRRVLSLYLTAVRQSSSRPTFAPKPQLDIKHIRQSPGLYEQNCIDRNYEGQARHSWRILELHTQWQKLRASTRDLRERNNAIQKRLGAIALQTCDGVDGQGSSSSSSSSSERTALIRQAKEYKTRLDAVVDQEKALSTEIDELASDLPNLSSTFTPNGSEPKLLGYINEHALPTTTTTATRPSHLTIGSRLDLLDFSSAGTTSGWGWYFLRNGAALLEQALIQYALSVALGRGGWTVVSPPSLVYAHIASSCGFNPRDQNGEQQIYTLSQRSEQTRGVGAPRLCLAATAEIPFAGMNADKVLDAAHLPLRVIGSSRCYRAEAGARGADTKGLYRVHEFTKVEMFAWTLSSASTSPFDEQFGTTDLGLEDAETAATTPAERVFDEMLDIQKHILTSLDLPCRVLEMPATDLGASAMRKIDIEAWFPSRHADKQTPEISRDAGWGEVTSVSMCGDYQSRRLATRVKTAGRHTWPHTVNGTALAVPRVLAAILENGWDEATQSVRIPEVLRPWMGGSERLQRKIQETIDE